MDETQKKYIDLIKLAEKQFQLIVSVRLACTLHTQPLTVPDLWIYGAYKLEGREIQLTCDSADEAAAFLEHTIVHSWSIYLLEAINSIIKNPREHDDINVVSAFEISRLIRNAYSHGPFLPKWSIDPDCRNKLFKISNVISLDTTNLEQVAVKWQHYGGFISFWNLSHWIRLNILKDEKEVCQDKPYFSSDIIQQGRMIIQKNSKIPPDAEHVPLKIKEIAGKHYAIVGSDSDGEYKIELNENKDNVKVYRDKLKMYICT
jgi:hypothetical protein